MTEFSLEFLQGLVRQDHPDVELTSFEGAHGSNRGDNYTSMVYRLTLRGARRGAGGGAGGAEPWSGSLVTKCLPESIQRREAFKSEVLFRNEIAFYKKVWPAFSRFQAQRSTKKQLTCVPRCYLARSDLVILKDLRPLGFVMPDRRSGLTVEECEFVLRELAHFHALSLAMKNESPDEFNELLNKHDGISEVFFLPEHEAHYRAYYREAADNAVALVAEELADRPDKDKYLSKFRAFCDPSQFFGRMVALATPREPLAVVAHGDCWTNNFLFRHEGGRLAELYIVDYQTVRYASPALDLSHLLYTGLSRAQRARHRARLLRGYAAELRARCADLAGEDGRFCREFSEDALLEMIEEEFRRSSAFGLGIALEMFPIMTCDDDEAPNVYQEKESVGAAPGGSRPVWTANAACRSKMAALVQELVDEGLI